MFFGRVDNHVCFILAARYVYGLCRRQSGNWLFIAPRDGMTLLNRTNGQQRRYFASWLVPSVPAAPSGGSTVDSEARAAINALVAALRTAGVFPAS